MRGGGSVAGAIDGERAFLDLKVLLFTQKRRKGS